MKREQKIRERIYALLYTYLDDFETFSYIAKKMRKKLPSAHELMKSINLIEDENEFVCSVHILLSLYPNAFTFSQKMFYLEKMYAHTQPLIKHLQHTVVEFSELDLFIRQFGEGVDRDVKKVLDYHMRNYDEHVLNYYGDSIMRNSFSINYL